MTEPYVKNLDHLGLIAGFCQSIDFAIIIDNAIGTKTAIEQKVTYGQLVTAMVLNGLGLNNNLHMYGKYLKNKPLDKLLGERVKAEEINDDALGQTLDALYEYGVSKLY